MKSLFGRLLEVAAVLASLAFTILLTYEYIEAWYFAGLSAILYTYICLRKRLLAETVLQVFYFLMAFYGYTRWGEEGLAQTAPDFSGGEHGLIILGGSLLTAITGFLLKKYSRAALPYLDSFTTVFSIIGTFLMVFLVPVHWLYWIAINATAVYLYLRRDLYLTAFLFLLYTALSVNGYLQWNH